MNVFTFVNILSIRSRRASFSCKSNFFFPLALHLRSNVPHKISSLDQDYLEQFPRNWPYLLILDRYPMNSRHPMISSNLVQDIVMLKRSNRSLRPNSPHSIKENSHSFISPKQSLHTSGAFSIICNNRLVSDCR